MSKVVKKKSLSIKGVLNVNKDENTILVEIEDGEILELADLAQEYDGSEVSISIDEIVDIA